jgi:trehalose 6-phosphate phosphatase
MREAARALASRCTVCVVSGRDRPVVQQLMGVDDLVVAGSHGFDIWSPDAGTLEHDASSRFDALLARVRKRVQDEAGAIQGALIEPKKASVAVHYRLVSDSERLRIKALVDRLLAEHPDELKVTPGKMV